LNHIRHVAPICPHGRTHWRHLANTTEPSVCGGDAVLCQITLTIIADLQRLNAFLRRSIRQGFCSPDLTDITVIFDAADETLFCKILSDRNRLLAPLLPNEVCTPYHLRPRRHNRQLTPKVNKLCDSNFIQRMLYKDSHWLSCILSAFYFTCRAAFCQLIINEYRILLYYRDGVRLHPDRPRHCSGCRVPRLQVVIPGGHGRHDISA